MVRRLVLPLLVLAVSPIPAFADLRESIAKEAKLAAQQAPAPSRAINPYKKPALALMAGGAGLLVVGLLQERGAEVSTIGTSVSVTEKGGSKPLTS